MEGSWGGSGKGRSGGFMVIWLGKNGVVEEGGFV